MPTYQYACTTCGHQLEAVQSFTDEPLAECPACQGRLRKLFSAVGIVFKGSGFYRTDSRSGRTGHDSTPPARTPATVASAGGGSSNGASSSGDSKATASSGSASGSSPTASSGSSPRTPSTSAAK